MANCSCSGNSGSTYSTVNRSGYGCLSSVPNSNGMAYNCFLPPTNTAYYQNFPFYNGPCGTVAGENDSDNNGCGCSGNGNNNCSCCGWWSNCCNNCNNCGCGSDAEGSQNGCCSNKCGNGGNTMFCNCPCNPCCGPAAALVTSNGTVTTAPGGRVPVYMLSQTLDSTLPLALANVVGPISVTGDTIIFNCPGTYLIMFTLSLDDTAAYTGTIGLVLNGTAVPSGVFTLDGEAFEGTTQSLVRVTEGSTMTINTSAALTNGTAGANGNIVTLSILRIS